MISEINWSSVISALMDEYVANQQKIALKIGCSQQQVSFWLNQKSIPNETHQYFIKKLAEDSGVDIDNFRIPQKDNDMECFPRDVQGLIKRLLKITPKKRQEVIDLSLIMVKNHDE